MPRRCIHCLAPVNPPDEVCESCLDLLSDLGEDVVEPPPRPAPQPHQPFHPTAEDWAAYRTLSESGSFLPFDSIRPKQLPSHARNKWGKAIASTSRRDPDVPKK